MYHLIPEAYKTHNQWTQLKIILAIKIDEFINIYNSRSTNCKLVGHGSFFQARYVDPKLSRAIWDLTSDFDINVIFTPDEKCKKTLCDVSYTVALEFHLWFRDIVASMFVNGDLQQVLTLRRIGETSSTTKYSLCSWHLVDFTALSSSNYRHQHVLDEISTTKRIFPLFCL